MRLALILTSAVILNGCVYISDNNGGSGNSRYRPGMVPLYSASVESDGVHIVADSHGCTSEDSFNVITYRAGNNANSNEYHVRFERLSLDLCREFEPNGVELVYSFSRLGLPAGGNIIVDNPTNR